METPSVFDRSQVNYFHQPDLKALGLEDQNTNDTSKNYCENQLTQNISRIFSIKSLLRIQSLQSKILRTIVNYPFYVLNKVLHKDLMSLSSLSLPRYDINPSIFVSLAH